MLDTIRQLSRTVKLKDVIIGSFIPEDSAKGVERRAVWCQEEERWTIQKLVGNKYSTSYLPIYLSIYLFIYSLFSYQQSAFILF